MFSFRLANISKLILLIIITSVIRRFSCDNIVIPYNTLWCTTICIQLFSRLDYYCIDWFWCDVIQGLFLDFRTLGPNLRSAPQFIFPIIKKIPWYQIGIIVFGLLKKIMCIPKKKCIPKEICCNKNKRKWELCRIKLSAQKWWILEERRYFNYIFLKIQRSSHPSDACALGQCPISPLGKKGPGAVFGNYSGSDRI